MKPGESASVEGEKKLVFAAATTKQSITKPRESTSDIFKEETTLMKQHPENNWKLYSVKLRKSGRLRS